MADFVPATAGQNTLDSDRMNARRKKLGDDADAAAASQISKGDVARAAGDTDDLMPQSDDPEFAGLSGLGLAAALTKVRHQYNSDKKFREEYRGKKRASRELKAHLLAKAKSAKATK